MYGHVCRVLLSISFLFLLKKQRLLTSRACHIFAHDYGSFTPRNVRRLKYMFCTRFPLRNHEVHPYYASFTDLLASSFDSEKKKKFPINNAQNDSNKATGRVYSFLTKSRNLDNFRLTQP